MTQNEGISILEEVREGEAWHMRMTAQNSLSDDLWDLFDRFAHSASDFRAEIRGENWSDRTDEEVDRDVDKFLAASAGMVSTVFSNKVVPEAAMRRARSQAKRFMGEVPQDTRDEVAVEMAQNATAVACWLSRWCLEVLSRHAKWEPESHVSCAASFLDEARHPLLMAQRSLFDERLRKRGE